MEKEELLNRIAAAFGANDKEIKIAYDAFLQKISEELEPDEAVRIPMFGVFQIKKKLNDEPGFSVNKDLSTSYRLLFFPEHTNEVVELDFAYSNAGKKKSPESAFSLSVGKPIIPILESQKKELLVQSAYLNLLYNFKEKADALFENSVKLEGFNLENSFKELSSGVVDKENKNTSEIKTESRTEDQVENKNESIPWNFGSEITDEIPEQQFTEETPTDINNFEPVGDFELSDDDLKNINFDTFSIQESQSDYNAYEQVEDTNTSDSSEDDTSILSSEEKSEIESLIDNAAFDFNNPDIEENKEYEDFRESSGIPEDTSEKEPEATQEEDESDEENIPGIKDDNLGEDEVVAIDVNKAHEFSSQRNVPLEEVGDNEVHVKYSRWFWIVLLALLTITGGGIYYFLFSKHAPGENQKNMAVQHPKKIESEIIERDYKVPVSIIPKNNETAAEKTDETVPETKNENLAKTENIQSEKPKNEIPKNEKPVNLSSNLTPGNNKGKNTLKETEKKANLKDESARKSKLTEIPTEVNLTESGIERKDNKNTFIREFIFTDGKEYTIQLSSWKSKDIAIKEVKRLRKLGLDAYLTQSYVPSVGGTWFRVRVGEYPTIKNAEEALEKIK